MPKTTASDSDAPPSKTSSNGIKIQLKGASLKTIAMILAILGGGGGISVGVFQFATQDYVRDAVAESSTANRAAIEKNSETNQRQEDAISANGEGIENLQITLGEVQTIQRQQFARDEAKRITEPIANRHNREVEYDRLVDRNMWRLRDGKPPCSTVECSD